MEEIITLSSDEENIVREDHIPFKLAKKKRNKPSFVKPLDNSKKVTVKTIIPVKNIDKNKPHEVITIRDCVEKSFGSNAFQTRESTENCQNHSKSNILHVEVDQPKINTAGNNKRKKKYVKLHISPSTSNSAINELNNNDSNVNEGSNQNLKFFTEFVEFCGSLEEVESDRAKLTSKLMKRFGEAESHYIKSEEFRSLIQKFRDKVTKHNLYLIAKDITDELIYRKKIENNTGKTQNACQRSQQPENKLEIIKNVNENEEKGNKKQAKVLNKIIKKLDGLGRKIQELEEKEVDFSDEKESAFLQLHRYRERYCQIYTKLCKLRNVMVDTDRNFNRRIAFTESKYPKVNKCIENWLNKTKRFPDFSDILKLLESQSSSLNLPSNHGEIRAIAIDIFQKVGSMLQRRRKYEFWDSFCGYLNDEEDPARKDARLDEKLKRNFEIRIKKEQEILQYYAELQEKKRLRPEEVPDEEANRSPVECGNEDEQKLMNKFDNVLKENTEVNGHTTGKRNGQKEIPGSGSQKADQTSKEEIVQSKESKNNYKNCKSLKWRKEKGSKMKRESSNSEGSDVRQENEKKRQESSKNEITKGVAGESKEKKDDEDDSDLELIAVKSVERNTLGTIYGKVKADSRSIFETPTKRNPKFEGESPVFGKRKRITFDEDEDTDVLEIDDENEEKRREGEKVYGIFNVHRFEFFTDNVFEELYQRKKDWGKRKVFRDLTNLNRLMELQGKRRRVSGLFSSSFFRRSICEFEKSTWKRRYKMTFRSILSGQMRSNELRSISDLGSRDQKCALNQEEKSGKTVNSDSGGDSDEKAIQNNSEGRGDDEGNNFFSGRGNGSEGDNNEDENKKKGRRDVEPNEAQQEDEEEEEEEKKEDENNAEPAEHSLPNQKTEEKLENNTPSQSTEKTEEETNQRPDTSSETPANEEKEDKEETVGEESSTDVEDRKSVLEGPGPVESENVQPESEEKAKDTVTKNEEVAEAEESTPEKEELHAVNSGNEVTVVEKPNEDVDVVAISGSLNQTPEVENDSKLIPPKDVHKYESKRADSCTKVRAVRHKVRANATNVPKEYENVKTEKTKHLFPTNKPTTTWKPTPVDSSPQKLRKRSAPSTSDEEIVKRFLLHSPSSISITPPRKLTLSKSPSQAALQALATLRNLKGISATIVRGKPKESANGGSSYSRRSEQNSQNMVKRGRSDFPVISNVQSVTPKIVNVSGNVSGFGTSWPGISSATCDSSPIRISNVWGSLPNNFMPSMMNETVTPGCSSQKSSPSPSNTVKKKNTKKTVEYVVLD